MVWPFDRPARRDEGSLIPSQRADADIRERYEMAIALYGEAHGLDSRDYQPEQRERFKAHCKAVNGGFMVEAASFVRWLIEHGRLADDTDPTPEARVDALRATIAREGAGCGY